MAVTLSKSPVSYVTPENRGWANEGNNHNLFQRCAQVRKRYNTLKRQQLEDAQTLCRWGVKACKNHK